MKGFSAIGFLVTLGALAVFGGGIYYLWTESSHTSSDQIVAGPLRQVAIEATVAAAPTTGEFRSSVPRLVGRGDTLECDWRTQDSLPESPFNAGKLWTMGNQARSTMTATVNGVAMESGAIYKENTAYTWMTSNGAKTGYRFTQSDLELASESMTPEQKQQSQQINKEMIYNCWAWAPDPAKFVLPSDYTFRKM